MFMLKLSLILAVSFILLPTVGYVYSQDKNAPVIVKANLIVLDADKKIADDVKQADIKIFEDGIEQKITYFAKKEPVLKVGIVVDNSGSLREKLEEVIFMGSTIAENLRPNDEAFIVRFAGSDHIETMQEWTSDKVKLNIAVNNMFVQGGATAIIDAVYLSAGKIMEREKQDKSKRYALVVISDSLERGSYYSLSQLFSLFKDSDLQVFSISFPEEYALKQPRSGKSLLLNNTLASETGGTAYTLSKKYTRDEMTKYLKAIVAELHSNYIIGYTSTNQKRDGKERNLRVEVADGENGAKRSGLIREKFKVLNIKDITK